MVTLDASKVMPPLISALNRPLTIKPFYVPPKHKMSPDKVTLYSPVIFLYCVTIDPYAVATINKSHVGLVSRQFF